MLISVEGRGKKPWIANIDSPVGHTYIRFGLKGENVIRVRTHEDSIKVLRFKALRKFKKRFDVSLIQVYNCDLKGEWRNVCG